MTNNFPRRQINEFAEGFLLKCVAVILCLSSVACQSLFYFPAKQQLYDPVRVNLHPEDVTFKSSDGNDIHAWYFASTAKGPSKGTILFFHGNAENLTSHFLMFYWLPAQGYNYLIFDYPGYGKSTGKPTPEGTVKAGIAAAEWLTKNKDSRPVIIYGQSLGGVVALRTVEEIKDKVPIRNVVIDGSFLSYRQIARMVLSRQWWTWPLQPLTYLVLSDAYAPAALDKFSPLPLLFIHGNADTVIEPINSEKMFEKARQPKALWIVEGGHHGDLFEVNNRALREQFLSYLSKTYTGAP